MPKRPSVIRRTILTPIILIVVLLVMAALSYQFGSRAFNRTAVEMFINIMVVVGLYVFVGNSGLLSFGHISFMCLGAYMTAWLAIPPVMKSITLKGLPSWLLHTQ
jgi:branched-chain amino acid transport system permease protein